MSANLDPEELRALTGEPAASEVSRWDRGRLRRLSSDDVAEARRLIGRTLPRIERDLTQLSGFPVELHVGACHEVDAESIFESVEDPPALVCFRVDGQPGWCLWDNPSAVVTIEHVLGASDEEDDDEEEESSDEEKAESDGESDAEGATEEGEDEPEEPLGRFLTPMERRVLVRLLRVVVDSVAATLRLEPGEYEAVEMLKHSPTWRESQGRRPDPHRLAIDLLLSLPSGETTLSVYLPMPAARGPLAGDPTDGAADGASDVPDHLDLVPVEVDVQLGTVELTLSDLLSLEVGDVVPIDAALGDPVVLRASGVVFARGRVGTSRGHVAVVVEEIEEPQSDPS
ncbi:MAG: FliM/FliN family flagellar motor C-terminal domain-containing protein [Planctomycetota bacterium]